MTHTPSPWRIHTFTPKGWSTETTTILGPDDVAIVGGVHWGSADGSVGEANARLICRAPEMLAALKELWEVTEDACDAGFGFTPFQSEALSDARRLAEEVIRFAEGREP